MLSYCADFNGLLILAIGCSIAYIVKGEDTNFFLFLNMIDSAKEVLKKIKYIKYQIPSTFKTIKDIQEYRLDKLKEILGKNAGKIASKILECDIHSKSLEKAIFVLDKAIKYLEDLSNKYKSVKNLKAVAFMTFLYGFYISIFAPYYGNNDDLFNRSLLLMNVYIFIISSICLICDMREIELSKKTIFVFILPLIIYAILFRIFDKSITDWLFYSVSDEESKHFFIFYFIEVDVNRFNFIFNYNYTLTILMCFIGFLLYIIPIVFGSTLALIQEFKILYMSKDIKEFMSFVQYKSQLDKCISSNIGSTDVKIEDVPNSPNTPNSKRLPKILIKKRF